MIVGGHPRIRLAMVCESKGWEECQIINIHYGDGEKRYILHPRGAIIGDTIVSGTKVPISMGNALPLSAV